MLQAIMPVTTEYLANIVNNTEYGDTRQLTLQSTCNYEALR